MPSEQDASSSPSPGPIAESPWFWMALFSGMALAGMAATGPKYVQRRAGLWTQYQARQAIYARQLNESAGQTIATGPPKRPPPSLMPVAALIAATFVAAVVMLWRSRKKERRDRSSQADL